MITINSGVGMYCGRCGGYAQGHDLFCPHCGAPLGASVAGSLRPSEPHGPVSDPAVRSSWRVLALLAAASVLVVAGSVAAIVTWQAGAIAGHPVAGHARSTAAVPTPAVTKTVTASPTATPALDFAAIYARDQSGVVRIETLSCSEAGIGTGFLLSPTLIATVNHVIDQSVVVSLIDGDQRTTGTVVGADPSRDLALVKASRPIAGNHFRFAATTPSIGDQVAAIGFPIGNPITLTHGDISGIDRNVTVNGISLTGMLQTDAPLNPGNSGGPLIDHNGEVVGLVDALVADANGIAYAVPADQASTATHRWRQSPRSIPAARCSNPLGPAQASPDVPLPDDGQISEAQAAGIVAAFNTYFGGINTGNYAAAYAVLSPRLQSGSTEQQFADGDATSYDAGQEVLDAHAVDARTVQIALAFTSLQTAEKGPNGDTCDNWTIDYTMIQIADGSWLIDAAAPYHGVLHTTC